jgi:Co/Zn/Cd efflux system component
MTPADIVVCAFIFAGPRNRKEKSLVKLSWEAVFVDVLSQITVLVAALAALLFAYSMLGGG